MKKDENKKVKEQRKRNIRSKGKKSRYDVMRDTRYQVYGKCNKFSTGRCARVSAKWRVQMGKYCKKFTIQQKEGRQYELTPTNNLPRLVVSHPNMVEENSQLDTVTKKVKKWAIMSYMC